MQISGKRKQAYRGTLKLRWMLLVRWLVNRHRIDFLQAVAANIALALSYLLFFVSYGLKMCNFRVLAAGYNIGHFSEEPASYLKEQQLGRIPSYRTILFPPFKSIFSRRPLQKNFCNGYLVHLWKSRFFVVTNPFLAFLLRPILIAPWLQIYPEYCSDKPGKSSHDIHHLYYQKFSERPVLVIDRFGMEKGSEFLRSMGLKEQDWFVCFHAREPGYYVADDAIRCGVRNSDISTYDLALAEVARRGGWCIRIGSSRSTKLPDCLTAIPRVIDYPHTSYVSDVLDLFLLSRCRFLIGAQSGIINVPGLFSVPTVLVNIFPINNMPLHPRDLGIMKTYRCLRTGKQIPFASALRSVLAFSTDSQDYTNLEVAVENNTAEEIYDVVVEMFERLEGVFAHHEESEQLQAKFRRLIPITVRSKNAVSRLGFRFLRKYEHLLDEV